MTNEKILQMLNNGEIELLKSAIAEEIYKSSLKKLGGDKVNKRYTAMKKYFTYIPGTIEATQKACKVEYKGKEYTSFCNLASLVLTSENHSGIDLMEYPETYFRVDQLFFNYDEKMTLNIAQIIAEAKSRGYKLLKKEFVVENYIKENKEGYLVKIKDNYYNLALLDIAMSIIDDGTDFDICCNKRGFLNFYNGIGMGALAPFKVSEDGLKNVTVIDLNKRIDL